jgi:hypothetical protein
MHRNCTFLNTWLNVKSYFLPISIILRLIPIQFETLKLPIVRRCTENAVDEEYSYLWIYDLYGPVRNASDAGKSITRASGRGLSPSGAPSNRDFFGPCEMASSECHFGPKKIEKGDDSGQIDPQAEKLPIRKWTLMVR